MVESPLAKLKPKDILYFKLDRQTSDQKLLKLKRLLFVSLSPIM